MRSGGLAYESIAEMKSRIGASAKRFVGETFDFITDGLQLLRSFQNKNLSLVPPTVLCRERVKMNFFYEFFS